MPSSLQAADYSVTQYYLNAVKAINSDDGDKVLEQMRKGKVNDMYLMQVKTPAQSTTPWDYYNVVATSKGEEAFTTKAESRCALWK